MNTASDDLTSTVAAIDAAEFGYLDCAHALRTLCRDLDESGCISRWDAHQHLEVLRRASPAVIAALLQQPEECLGDFDSLPKAAQSAIVKAIADREAWQLSGYRLGEWYFALVRLLFALRNRIHGATASEGVVGQIADAVAFTARRAPAELLQRLHTVVSTLVGRYAARPSLSALFSAAGIDPRPLATCYARPLRQLEDYRGYWYEAAAHRAVGMVIGIDFLQTPAGYLFIEGNCTFGQKGLAGLYDPDPMVENMLDFATTNGFRRLVVADGNSDGVVPLTANRYRQGALRRGIELTLVDRENVPKSRFLRSHGIPRIGSRDTLILRTKGFPGPLDYIARIKSASLRALQIYERAHPGSGLLLPASDAEPVFGAVDAAEPFPNVIYKLPELDQGRGVIFLKARSASHARQLIRQAIRSRTHGSLQARLQTLVDRGGGFYQAYYKSIMRADRRLCKVRAHVLISPCGVRFLSACRVVAKRPVAESLPFGLVEDAHPYLVNVAGGGSLEPVPDSETPALEQASVAVGRALASAFDHGLGAATDSRL